MRRRDAAVLGVLLVLAASSAGLLGAGAAVLSALIVIAMPVAVYMLLHGPQGPSRGGFLAEWFRNRRKGGS